MREDEYTYQWQTVRYQWGDSPYPYVIAEDIEGATSKDYNPAEGMRVRCVVTATKKAGPPKETGQATKPLPPA